MKCIVLSGATVPFTGLVAAVDKDVIAKLNELGFNDIEVQYGHARQAFTAGSLPGVHGFDFDPQLRERISSAQLVISHAGSGSILDSLERGEGISQRRIIVVVNNALMDNHQLELAEKLESEGCVYVVREPALLCTALQPVMDRKFAKLPEPVSLRPVIDRELADLKRANDIII